MLTFEQAKRRMVLLDRAAKRRQGKLPGSSALPHPVRLGDDMVEPIDWVDDQFGSQRAYPPASKVRGLIEATTNEEYDLWFDQDGHSFVSFEDEIDATMFRLSLEESPL